MSDETDEKSEKQQLLEDEFKAIALTHMEEIEQQVEIAQTALAKAQKLSDQYGLPFYSSVSPLGQPYTPQSFFDKFGDNMDASLVGELIHCWVDLSNDYSGWQTSSIC